MFRGQSQAEVTHHDEKENHASRRDLPPRFSEHKNRDQQNWKDEAGFFAQRAQEKKSGGRDLQQPAISAGGGRNANRAVKPEKSEHRRQRVGPAGNVSDRRGVSGMNRPNQRGDECDPAPFPFLDIPAAQKFVPQKKQRERRAEMAKDAGQMITGRFENERGVIDQVAEALDRPIEIGRRRVDKKEMLERLGNQLPAADKRIAQDERGIVPDKIIPQGRRVGRKNGAG